MEAAAFNKEEVLTEIQAKNQADLSHTHVCQRESGLQYPEGKTVKIGQLADRLFVCLFHFLVGEWVDWFVNSQKDAVLILSLILPWRPDIHCKLENCFIHSLGTYMCIYASVTYTEVL